MKIAVTFATTITKEIEVDVDKVREKAMSFENKWLDFEDFLWDEIYDIMSREYPNYIDIYSAKSKNGSIYIEK